MPIWGTILKGAGEILKPISDIVDNVTTNKEEKAKAEAEIKKIVFDYEAKVMEQFKELEQAYLNDVNNARLQNMKAMENNDPFVRRFSYYLAALIVLAVFGLFAFIIAGKINHEIEAIVYTVLGALTASLTQVLSFFFGSTRGADSKNETIKNLSKG